MEKTPSRFKTYNYEILAYIFDFLLGLAGVIIFAIPAIAVLVLDIVGGNPFTSTSSFIITFLSGGFSALVALAYMVLLPASNGGQTLGMKFFKIKMIGKDNSDLTVSKLLIRSLVFLLCLITTAGLYLLAELISLSSSKSHKAFLNAVAGISVVDAD